MTHEQAKKISTASRVAYASQVMKPGYEAPGRRWYRDNTREPIRDETLRDGLVSLGAVIEKTDLATTSSKPRYCLQKAFAGLFDPNLGGATFEKAARTWQERYLSKGAIARIVLVRSGATLSGTEITVRFPNGETRRMKPGLSSLISKAVIEEFAPRFLQEPVVLFVSESGKKIVAKDDDTARAIGLTIRAEKNLPDTILVDLGPKHPLLVFVEAVATDGPINERRKMALEGIALDAGFSPEHVAFVTAYLDRSGGTFRRTVDALAWGSYAWFVSEPDGLVDLTQERDRLRSPRGSTAAER
jgi:hypothetical protein